MGEKPEIILAGEEAFARRVALAVIVTTSVSAWQFFMPFMFIFDFFKRGKAIRRYTQRYMFLRKMALGAAEEIRAGKDMGDGISPIESTLSRHWRDLGPSSESLTQCCIRVAHLLVDHYLKMLDAGGDSYSTMIRSAYPAQQDYAAYLTRLSASEKEADLLLMEAVRAPEDQREKVSAEHRQLERQREKDLVIIY